MLPIILAIVPIFLLIVLGAGMRRFGFPGEAYWPLGDRINYFIFFPALLIDNLASAKLGGLDPRGLLGALLLAILIQAGLVFALRPLYRTSAPGFTSVFQGAVRFNTFIGLAAVVALFNADGIALFAVGIGLAIPIINVLCVLTLARYGDHGQGTDWRSQLLFLAKNPLFLSCLLGAAMNLLGIGLPLAIAPVVKMLGATAAPLGLLTVGAGLHWESARNAGRPVILACLLKLLAYPLIALGLARLWGLGTLETQIAVLWAAMPSASSSYILARQMGGDAPMSAAIVTASTVLAFFTMPLLLTLVGV
jgi:predicted permease